MAVIPIIIVLIVVGFVLFLIQTAPIPIHPWIKNAIMGIIFICALIWLLQTFGFHTGLNLRVN